MRHTLIKQTLVVILCAGIAALFPANFFARPSAMDSNDVKTWGAFSVDKAPRGRTIQAAVVIEIPDGYHVNSNRPLGKFAIPTSLKIEAPNGFRTGPVSYPRGAVKSFSFSNEKLAVFEGRAVLRFNITVPADYKEGSADLHAKLRFQSCTNEVCFPPDSRDISMQIDVVGPSASVKNVNTGIFGGGRRR